MFRLNCQEKQEILKLDEYFKKTVIRMRPYLLSLVVSQNIELCKAWLDKLRCATTQRKLRNAYLNTLFRQLESGMLRGVFTKLPPNGRLTPLTKYNNKMNRSSSLSDLSDNSKVSCHRHLKLNMDSINSKCEQSNMMLKQSDTDSQSECMFQKVNHTPKTVKFHERKEVNTNQLQCYKLHIENLTSIIKQLHIENKQLNQELLEYREKSSDEEILHLQANIKKLTTEILSLKSELSKVQKLKDILEDNHTNIVQQYNLQLNDQFNHFKCYLKEVQSKNTKLLDDIAHITKKLDDITQERGKQIKLIKKECIEKLKSVYQVYETLIKEKDAELTRKGDIIFEKDKELSQIVSKRQEVECLNEKISDLEIKLDIKSEDENKLRTMLTEQYTTMKKEFSQLRKDIDFTSQKQNENLVNKIAAMKKIILKLEKSKEKLQFECDKKMYRLTMEKEWEVRSLQFQLQLQRSEISTSLSLEKQSEINNLLNVLDERCKIFMTVNDCGQNQRNHCISKTLYDNQSPIMNNGHPEKEIYV